MTDEKHDPQNTSETSRRDFIAMSVAAGLVAAVGFGVRCRDAGRRDRRHDQNARRHM